MAYPQSAYIHIPFCSSKCFYCAFTSTCNLKLELGYLIALLKDIDTNYQGNELSTLYFGGGTPSLLPLEHVKKIINKFNLAKDAEVTFELNPENATENYLTGLLKLEINRLSIGIQTFDDNILKLVNRRHDSKKAIEAITLAKKVGFENISLDFIYGLPTQTLDGFKSDLIKAKELDIQHISLYGLKIEEKSVFACRPPQNLPDDDAQADMYLCAIDTLSDFTHYEISNFAKSEAYQSRHNLNYWTNSEYYGFGCAAHGYQDGIRYANSFDIHKYIESPLLRDFGHTETEKEKLEEEIFLGLRISKGLNVSEINQKYSIDFDSKYSKIIEKYVNSDHLIKTDIGYKLSNQGFLLSTIILADFLD